MSEVLDKQKLLVEYLIASPDTFALCKSILKASYFNPEYRAAVKFIHSYYDRFSSVPDPTIIEAETGLRLATRTVTRDQIEYCSSEVEKFCKEKGAEAAVIECSTLLGTPNSGKILEIITEAMSISLTKDLGIQYFDNPLDRLQKMLLTPQRVPTKWTEVDELLGGGLARGELLLLSANSGGGKSITLGNLALNMASQGLNVLYISLELSEEMISQRFDTMLTGISTVNWRANLFDIADTVDNAGAGSGHLMVKRMSSGTCGNDIRAYLKEYELKLGVVPDLLVIDYLDIMGTNDKQTSDNVSEKDKKTTEQLIDILSDYNLMGATASQQNRSAIEATELNQGHIAGGLTKVNGADWYISIVMTPAMKAQGEMMFVFLKARSSDATGKVVSLKWVNSHLRILDADKDELIVDNFKERPEPTIKRSLLDIMDV